MDTCTIPTSTPEALNITAKGEKVSTPVENLTRGQKDYLNRIYRYANMTKKYNLARLKVRSKYEKKRRRLGNAD